MKNARRYDDRVTLGLVPDTEDLEQLKSLAYKTLIDVRDEQEKFGGFVEQRARELGLNYISIPISRDEIRTEDLEKFYRTVYQAGNEPLYVFSRFGRKPLAFLLLLEAVVEKTPFYKIFQKARRFGLGGLDGDLSLQSFLVEQINAASFDSVLRSVAKDRPEWLRTTAAPNSAETEPKDTQIDQNLEDLSSQWAKTKDKEALRVRLKVLMEQLES